MKKDHRVVISLDLGTTGNRAIAWSQDGRPVASSYYEFPQYFPQDAWVEHDANEIWQTTQKALFDVLEKVGPPNVAAIGISNQRETTVIWNKKTGQPIHNAIVWQCRRTSKQCEALANKTDMIKAKTGLRLDAYFSATKIEWLLDNVTGARDSHDTLAFGTIDSWLLWKLSNGAVHATDTSNASRTMLFNIHTMDYDAELLDLFHVPRSLLPQVKDSNAHFGHTDASVTGLPIPITAIMGDQQAALYAQCRDNETLVKNTYGTGLFLVACTGNTIPETDTLVNTVAWTINGKTSYALEGSVFVGGSAIQWLRDGISIIESASESEAIASSVASNEGLVFVPALTGLGAPHWDSDEEAC